MKHDKIKELRKQISNLQEELGAEFKSGLEALLKEHPAVESISISINNHEFNDGDATHFSLYWEDMEVIFKEDLEDEAVEQLLLDYFAQFDDNEFWEKEFGECWESLNISLQNGKLEY